MRKGILLLFITFLCFSCSSIEKDAENQMKKTMMEYAKNPDTFKISNLETIYKSPTDSLIVLRFIGKGQNGFGGYSSYYEYFYHIDDDGKRYEILVDLEEDKGNSFKELKSSDLIGLYPDSLYDHAMRLVVSLRTVFHGREVVR